MEKRIITISREYGSGGRYIGEKLAERTGLAFYDKEIIARLAQETGLDERFIEQRGEYSPTKSMFAYAFVGRDSTGQSLDDYLFRVQKDMIKKLAEETPCVIVGRCADYILRDRTDVAHVFIHGNEPEKLRRLTELYGISEAEAARQMKDMDKKRSVNYNYYTDRKWGSMKNYTLTLNSSEVGYEGCIRILAGLLG